MSNRNFDNRVIIQRLQQQTYARNLYQTNMNGQSLISNPQNSDGTSSRLTTFVSGAQTDYFRGLIGAGETISLGGIFGISPFIIPTVTVPGPPRITEITDGNTQLTVRFVAPLSGGSAITDYEYSTDNGGSFTSARSTDSPIIIMGLANGTTYQVVIRAVNQIGVGPYSNMVEGTPATVPGPPTILTPITEGNTQLTVAFTASATGGSVIQYYEYSKNGEAFTSIGSTVAPFTITGLTNGTPYTVVMRAHNRMGDSVDSAPASGTPATVPGPPTNIVITDGNTQLTVAFTPPASTGGSVITGYQYVVNNSSYTCAGLVTDITGNTFIITGLTNGTSYGVFISAVNRMGNGTHSDTKPGTPATVPSAPTSIVITPENQQLLVVFTAPTSNGGAAITNYLYQKNSGESFVSAGTTTSPFTITGLTNGTSYSVVLRAVNRMDPNGGTISDPRVVATPISVPSAPTITGITSGNQLLTVAFRPPATDGGSPITNYKYSTNGGAFTALSQAPTTSSITIPNSATLINGTSYQVRILAVTLIGDGDPSDPASGTPQGPPSDPTITGITEQNTQLAIAFSPPTTDGGSVITNYEYSTDNGTTFTALNPVDTISPITIPNSATLTNGTLYSVRIRARNNLGPELGTGTVSNMVTAKPQPTGPVVDLNVPVEYDPSAGTITVTCDLFTSFTPDPAYSSYYASDQNAAYVESITNTPPNNPTNTIVVITQFYRPGPGTVDSTITFGDGVRTSLASNIFQS
jgi:titin